MKRKVLSGFLLCSIVISTMFVAGCAKESSEVEITDAGKAEESTITGLNVAWLGSDAAEGAMTDGVSYVDYLAERNDMQITKETKAGSSMVDSGADGYIARLEKMDTDVDYDMFIVEMPICDVNATVGEISESTDRDDYDVSTLYGSMQYIYSYVEENFDDEVVFVTPAKCDVKGGDDYAQTVWEIKKHYDSQVLDLWHNINLIDADEKYLCDSSNPSVEGIKDLYIPCLEEKLISIIHEIKNAQTNKLPQYALENVDAINDYPDLKGKKIIFLGSSVTYGSASRGVSFADYIGKRDGVEYIKEAVSGTTLVTSAGNESSYIARMEANIEPQDADLLICQLSTNDATQDKPLGEISDSKDMEDFDTETVAGAIEYIIAYAEKNYNCPVMFYTGTKYDSEKYEEMVNLLLEIQKKWGIGVIDMWNDLPVEDLEEGKYDYYMDNGIHPNRAGYLEWWTPFFEKEIDAYLKAQ